MLASVSSRELTEWQALERVEGPLGSSWQDEIQAATLDVLQQLLYTTRIVNADEKKRHSIPEPDRTPRPYDREEQEEE